MFARYFFVGGVAAAVDIATFILAVKGFNFDWFVAALSSFLIATVVNYLLSVRYVFNSGIRFEKQTEIFLIFLISGIGLMVNQFFLWLLIEVGETNETLSKLLATGAVFAWNYIARKRFIFEAPR